MRTLTLGALALALLASSCNRKKPPVPVQLTEEEAPGLAATVQAADPRTSSQLVRGFHGVEQNAWRWTEGKFAAILRPPRGAGQKGAVLVLKGSVPDPVIARLQRITLTARANGVPLAPESFDKPGDFLFSREIPASALGGDSVSVEFVLDKFLAAGTVDQRELGIVVTSVGLEAK